MRILVMGGSWFLGRALAESAPKAGHSVTVFNRGRSGEDPEGTAAVRGDRTDPADLERLAQSGPYDLVLDPSGQVPAVVLAGARALAEAGGYVFISSVSAYTGWPIEPLTEESGLLACPSDAGPDYGTNGPNGYPTTYGYANLGMRAAAGRPS